MFATAAVTACVLALVPAPYGRHARPGWGPRIGTRAAWVAMEAPAAIVFAAAYALGPHPARLVPCLLVALWEVHYAYRAFVYPFRLRVRAGADTPVVTAAAGALFSTWNGWLNGLYLATWGQHLDAAWLGDPRFVVGVALFATGTAINRWSDGILRGLRRPGEDGYRVPRGGPFRFVSAPNYLGEIVLWTGFAVASWSPAAAAFAAFTAANLVPRAVAHHRWYRRTFPDYPSERRALLPWLL